MPTQPSRKLATFPNPRPGRDYVIRHVCPEYTALCPVTGQPDFGTIVVQYVPDARCVELKSLKLYLWSFRDEGHFFEDVTNRILDDLVKAMRPKRIRVTGRFAVRGGIWTRVVARWDAPGARDTAPVRGRGRGPLRAGSGTATRAGAARRRAR